VRGSARCAVQEEIRGSLTLGHYLARKVNKSLTGLISDPESWKTGAELLFPPGHPLANL